MQAKLKSSLDALFIVAHESSHIQQQALKLKTARKNMEATRTGGNTTPGESMTDILATAKLSSQQKKFGSSFQKDFIEGMQGLRLKSSASKLIPAMFAAGGTGPDSEMKAIKYASSALAPNSSGDKKAVRKALEKDLVASGFSAKEAKPIITQMSRDLKTYVEALKSGIADAAQKGVDKFWYWW